MTERTRVAPELARYIEDYVEETDIGGALGSSLDSDSNLIVFCQGFFSQFFANVIGEPIETIGARSAQRANVLLRRRRAGFSATVKRLIRRFQHFCKLYPDLLGERYGGGLDAVAAFHFEFVPAFLLEIEAWATEEREEPLKQAIGDARAAYAEFENSFEPPEE